MNSVFSPTRMLFTIDRYQKMVATGVLTRDDHVELIDGEILETAPVTPQYASVTSRVCRQLILALGDAATVGVRHPMDLGQFSEPQPDLLVLKPRPDGYSSGHPQVEDVLLLIEIADSSLAFDSGKKRDLYARSGVSEYWIMDLNSRRTLVFLSPADGAFQRTREYLSRDCVSPVAIPKLKVDVNDLFT
jgi:Uma2 family endonuclease